MSQRRKPGPKVLIKLREKDQQQSGGSGQNQQQSGRILNYDVYAYVCKSFVTAFGLTIQEQDLAPKQKNGRWRIATSGGKAGSNSWTFIKRVPIEGSGGQGGQGGQQQQQQYRYESYKAVMGSLRGYEVIKFAKTRLQNCYAVVSPRGRRYTLMLPQ
ncbi:MAG: hypothetical protein D6735_01600 [Acidobacteria bacterium]|nr:MAG: hypothetical protein D6735_01600 [Acidobacteriota bacterium]